MVVEAMSQLSPQALEALRRCHMPGGHSGAIGLLEAALSRYESTHTACVITYSRVYGIICRAWCARAPTAIRPAEGGIPDARGIAHDGAAGVGMLRCPICLDDDAATCAAPMTSSSDGGDSARPDVQRCSTCLAPFHRPCAGRMLVAAAEEGGGRGLPVRCPLPGCLAEWKDGMINWALDEEQRVRFDTACRAAEELRAAAASKGGAGRGEGGDSPRSAEALHRLGVRSCPQCCALIQKQAEGLMTGCDKMTCRCGCMFCFQCGTEARAGGVARCRCVGSHHSFIPHAAVVGNYAGMRDGAIDDGQDLTKKKRGKASGGTLARLRKELKSILADPPPFVHVRCPFPDAPVWSFVIQGPPDTPYAGGCYWGRLSIPDDYPFSPPLICILTPSGRFEPDQARAPCSVLYTYRIVYMLKTEHSIYGIVYTHARARAHTHTHTHARTNARTHARTHARARTHTHALLRRRPLSV